MGFALDAMLSGSKGSSVTGFLNKSCLGSQRNRGNLKSVIGKEVAETRISWEGRLAGHFCGLDIGDICGLCLDMIRVACSCPHLSVGVL